MSIDKALLYTTEELEKILNKNFSRENIDNWAKSHDVFFNNNVFVWTFSDIDLFLNANFNKYEVIEIKVQNRIKLSENEIKDIILNNNTGFDLSEFYKYLSTEEIVSVKKSLSIQITEEDCKNKIQDIKNCYINNVENEQKIINKKIEDLKDEINVKDENFRNTIIDTINDYQYENTKKLLRRSKKYYKISPFTIILLIAIFSFIFGFISFFIW